MSTPIQAAKAGHTPTPWVVKKVKTSIGHCFKVGSREMVEHPHGGICLYDDDTSLNPHERGRQEVNANHIVECVNSHDALLSERDRLREALIRAIDTLQYISDGRESQSVTKLHLGDVAKNRLTDVRAALKEGK